jgi:hypothetical protein
MERVRLFYSFIFSFFFHTGNYTVELEILRNDFEERTSRTTSQVKQEMKIMDRGLWRCDPVEHVEGKTYLQLTRLLQGVYEHLTELNDKASCGMACNRYTIVNRHHSNHNCNGTYYYCIEGGFGSYVCPADTSSARRYEYIEYYDHTINGLKRLGEKGGCKQKIKFVTRGYLSKKLNLCPHCLCMCDQQGVDSDRYFSLRESVSDLNKNM